MKDKVCVTADKRIFCPECGSVMVLRETPRFKYKDGVNRKFYGCSRYPDCQETHGAQPDGTPLGKPANAEVRALRHKLHEIANHIWEYADKAAKAEMYRWLRSNTRSGHIGSMDKEELLDLEVKLQNLA